LSLDVKIESDDKIEGWRFGRVLLSHKFDDGNLRRIGGIRGLDGCGRCAELDCRLLAETKR
jgi:hypothetical protein